MTVPANYRVPAWDKFCFRLSWWLGGRWGRKVVVFGHVYWDTKKGAA